MYRQIIYVHLQVTILLFHFIWIWGHIRQCSTAIAESYSSGCRGNHEVLGTQPGSPAGQTAFSVLSSSLWPEKLIQKQGALHLHARIKVLIIWHSSSHNIEVKEEASLYMPWDDFSLVFKHNCSLEMWQNCYIFLLFQV